MLSRANSGAGNRLRRAKSTSSVHQRPIDIVHPQVDHRQAEVAAAEAYRRAYQNEQLQQTRQAMQRRHNRSTRISEGSHFEENRNRTRRTPATTGSPRQNVSTEPQKKGVPVRSNHVRQEQEELVVARTRRHLEAEATLDRRYPPQDGIDSIPSSYRRPRKSQSSYSPGRPDRQNISALNAGGRNVFAATIQRQTADAPRSVKTSESRPSDVSISTLDIPAKASVENTQTEEASKAIARDAYLQDFHHRKLRHRSSFIDPIKKRLQKFPSKTQDPGFDNSVPPFNLADEATDIFLVPPEEPQAPAVTTMEKPRVASESLKSKFKRMLGRSKRINTDLPMQHVEATRLHFHTDIDTDTAKSSQIFTSQDIPPPSRAPPSPPATIRTRHVSNQSAHSMASGTSRFTSWTDSTVAGTIRTRTGDNSLLPIEEQGLSAAKKNISRQRSGSFAGRALRLPFRRQSRAQLVSSEGLYQALLREIESPTSQPRDSIEAVIDGSPAPQGMSLAEALASKEGLDAAMQPPRVPSKYIIRAVTPDVQNEHRAASPLSIRGERVEPPDPNSRDPSNQPENSSKEAPAVVTSLESTHDQGPGIQISVPLQDAIARRVQRSQNRWQSALEDRSLDFVCGRRQCIDENPYGLNPYQALGEISLPVAIRHENLEPQDRKPLCQAHLQKPPAAREAVVSPSVYSYRENTQSPRPESPVADEGSVITITGHEIKRYSLEPPAKPRMRSNVTRPSRDWKRWLSKEMHDLSSSNLPNGLDLLPKGKADNARSYQEAAHHNPNPTISVHRREHAQRCNSNDRPAEVNAIPYSSPSIRAPRTGRPKMASKTSSSSGFMNERFPMIETGRKISNKSVTKLERFTSRTKTASDVCRADSPTAVSQGPTGNDECLDYEKVQAAPERRIPTMARPRSMAQVNSQSSIRQCSSEQGVQQATPKATKVSTSKEQSTQLVLGSRRPKARSNFDLRASYRTSNNFSSNNITIRRKPITTTLLEDHTLRRISAGPYASDLDVARGSPANKENMPSMPSGTWLASGGRSCTPGDKEHDASPIPSPLWMPSTKASPARSSPRPGAGPLQSKDSPGHRLADSFLNTRHREKGDGASTAGDSWPAFV